MKHTEGKWNYNKESGWLEDKYGEIICQFWNKCEDDFLYREANAQRIVACVNACKGIATTALNEQPLVVNRATIQLQAQLDHSEKVKAELLEALKRLYSECKEDSYWPDLLEHAKQAIKKAEKE